MGMKEYHKRISIIDLPAWAEQHETVYESKGKDHVSYGNPRTYYKVAHYTDEVLLECSMPSILLWHKALLELKSSTDQIKSMTAYLHPSMCEDLMKRNSFYKAIEELVRHRLIIPTHIKSTYAINIQHAYKLNHPSTYSKGVAKRATRITIETDNIDYDDTRPLVF